MQITFLGTGAADWSGKDERGEERRLTSTLFDGKLLIDVTETVIDSIMDKAAVETVLFTHSHSDHFSLSALRKLAPCTVYCYKSWANLIDGEGITVVPLDVDDEFDVCGYHVIAVPGNHATEKPDEQPLHYLLMKDGKTLLYATDGAWMTCRAHLQLMKHPADVWIVDATVGYGHKDDFRIFEHNTMDMIEWMLPGMTKNGLLKKDAPVYLTHMARTLHPTQKELEASIHAPFVAAYDGFTCEV